MSIEITNETKSVGIVKTERSWREEIFTELGTDYTTVIHREEVTTLDGEVISKDRVNLQVPNLTVKISDLVASDAIIPYKDIDGVDKTIALKDVPLLLPEVFEYLIAQEKARLDAMPVEPVE